VCNVPHAATLIPQQLAKDFVVSDQELAREVRYMADNYTDTLYEELLTVSSSIRSIISRVVVDIERFENEADEPMSSVGMSAFYTRTSSGGPLRNITQESKGTLEEIYRQYHAAFTDLVQVTLEKHQSAIVVDCHSFPSVPRSYEPDQQPDRPDICIGTDDYHTPQALADILKTNFEVLGYLVGIGAPFGGSIVPPSFYKKDRRVSSVMIEVNRKLYMDEKTFQQSDNFSRVGKNISRCVIQSLNQFVKLP